jgi:L-gulonolactone oxidase
MAASDSDPDLPPPVAGRTFSTWSGTHVSRPSLYFEPDSVRAVCAVLGFARARGLFVRVIGSAHSPNACAMADGARGVMMSLCRLAAVRSIDATTGRVVVDAGMRVSALNAALDAKGLAIPNLGSISDQTVAGCFMTGTHGTGVAHGVLSTTAVRLWLVTAAGDEVVASASERPDLFRAALCSLGLLGVIVRVELQTVPAFHLDVRASPDRLDAVLRDLPARILSAPYYRFWWFPHTGHVWEWRATPRAPPLPASASPAQNGGVLGALAAGLCNVVTSARAWMVTRFFGYHCFQVALLLATRAPWLVPHINRLWRSVLFSRPVISSTRSFDSFNFDCLFKQHVSEFAIPLCALPKALADLQVLLAAGGPHHAHFPVEVRTSAGDDIPLSPAFGRATAWIGIIAYKPFGFYTNGHVQYFRDFERIMVAAGGRSHWAKDYDIPFAAALYPRYLDFAALRAALDPTGLFLNPWAQRVLESGSDGAREAARIATADAAEEWGDGDMAALKRFMVKAGEPAPSWQESQSSGKDVYLASPSKTIPDPPETLSSGTKVNRLLSNNELADEIIL